MPGLGFLPIRFQLIFIINAKLLRIPIILQPHGMLLDSALKTKPYLKYLTKLFIFEIYSSLALSKSI